tara:strand:+ start:2702 stop:3106 length:405 start_codon:yes stop_codon:yes gene_type:complete
MKIYCKKCGAPTEYISAKPKFCATCGEPLSAVASQIQSIDQRPQKVEKPRKDQITAFEIQEEPAETESIPNMQGLDVDIETGKVQGVQFGDVLGSAEGSERFNREPDQQMSPEQFARDFKREAGSIRNTAPDEE